MLDRRHRRGFGHCDRGLRRQKGSKVASYSLIYLLGFPSILSRAPSLPSLLLSCIIEEYTSMFISFFTTALLTLFSSPVVRADISVQTPVFTQVTLDFFYT
jgi:hypothetical protein